MIGAEYLRDLRRQGMKPAIVFVMDIQGQCSTGDRSPDVQLENNSHAEVHIERSDNLADLDFRFLTGCVVAINADDKDRARRLFKYIKAQRPKSITVSDGTFVHHEVMK